jgi:hypothetical protein
MVKALYRIASPRMFFFCCLWLYSCVEQIQVQEGPPDDGIEYISLIIGQDNLTELLKATFVDRWFPLFVERDTGKCDARIRIHGLLARHYPKKTFKV